MRYLKSFSETLKVSTFSNESFTNIGYGDISDDRIEDNIKDIFVEYQDSHELDVEVGKGFLPITIGLDDNVLMVKLFSQRGIRLNDISVEVDMLIDYVKSLTDNKVKVYYRFDKGLLYYNVDGMESSRNTIEIFLVECVGKTNESLDIDDKVIEDITDMFVELKDAGINYLVSKEDPYLTVKGQDGIGIILHKNRNDATIDLELVRDCVEMTKDYLSGLFDFTEFYRFGFVWSTSPDLPKGSRSSLECNSFPDDLTKDIRKDLFVSSYQGGFYYELEGIKIVFIQK